MLSETLQAPDVLSCKRSIATSHTISVEADSVSAYKGIIPRGLTGWVRLKIEEYLGRHSVPYVCRICW